VLVVRLRSDEVAGRSRRNRDDPCPVLEQPLEDFDPAHCCDHEINLRRLFHRKPIL
jgi:hypothetical protein